MRALSPRRRLSITKNTNYPSVATLDRRPSEFGLASNANMRSSSQELDTSRQRLEKIHMKSITELDGQRKALERSMLAYTQKMKELNDNRTNNLFRGIQIRMATSGDKPGPRSLPASVELNDTSSSGPVDSAKLRRRRVYGRKHGSLSDRPMVIRTPIQEESEPGSNQSSRAGNRRLRPSSADIFRRNENTSLSHTSVQKARYSSPDVLVSALNGADNENVTNSEYQRVNITIINADSSNDNYSYPTKIVEIMTKPKLHVISEDKSGQSTPEIRRERSFCESVRDDGSDSAYSSCHSDEESTLDSTEISEAEGVNNKDSDNKAKHSVRFVEPNPEDGYLLTVPKVHKRKRKSVTKKGDISRSKSETLLKKAILKNATTKQ